MTPEIMPDEKKAPTMADDLGKWVAKHADFTLP